MSKRYRRDSEAIRFRILLLVILLGCFYSTSILASCESIPLVSNQSYFIFEDSRSNIWISQSDRIIRLAGNSKCTYFNNEKGLQEITLQSEFFEDENGNIWFTTSNFLVRYSYELDWFDYYSINDESKDYRLIEIEPDGNVLLQAGSSIYRFLIENKGFILIYEGFKCIDFEVFRNGNNDIKSIIGTRWAYGPGCLRLQFEDDYDIALDTILKEEYVYTSYKLEEKYIGFGAMGVFIWDSSKGIQKIELDGKKLKGGFPLNNAEILVFNSKNLFKYNIKRKTLIELVKLDKNFDDLRLTKNGYYLGLGNDDIAYMLWMKNEDVWNIYPTSSPVFSIKLIAPKERLYYSLDNDSLQYVNLKNRKSYHLENMLNDAFFSLRNDDFLDIASSEVHIGIDLDKDDVSNFERPNTVGMEGLHRISKNKVAYFHANGLKIENSEGKVISEHFKGSMLSLPFYSDSEIIYTVSDDSIIHFKIENEIVRDEKALMVKFYIHQFSDYLDSLIIMATNKGLKLLDPERSHFFDFALEGEFVNSIVVDENNSIWSGCSNGLVKLDTLGNRRFYSSFMGLPTNDFSLNCATSSADGTLYFGTNKGILYFHPDSIKDIDYNPPMMLTSLKIYDHEWAEDTLNIEVLDNIDPLEYNQNTLTFDFVAIDYDPQNHPQYSVYLEGYDVDTTLIGDVSKVTYPNLRPGDYRFHYSACTLSGYCRDEFETFDFTIRPPYWETWWFRTLGVLAVLGIVGLGIGLYLRNRLREQRFEFEKQQLVLKTELQLQQERNRIADELHDELGGKLSSIKFAGKKVQKATHIDDVKKITQRVSEISTELIESMRSIIWAMDTQNDTLASLQANVRSYASTIGKDNDLKMTFNFQETKEEVIVKGQIRHHLFLTIKEILNNIIKHSSADEVSIAITVNDKILQTIITENGPGFALDEISNFGKGIKSIAKRMSTIDSDITYNNAEKMSISIATPLD